MGKKLGWGEMDKSKTPFEKLRVSFEVYNRTTNKSLRTVGWYNEKLKLFHRYLGPTAVLADVNVENVRGSIADLQSRDVIHANNRFQATRAGSLSSSYIQGFARALKAFASWLHEDGYTEVNVLKNIKPPKMQKKVIEVLNDEEVSRLLSGFDRNQPHGARNYALILTMLDTGLRAAEICNLRLEDAHLDQGYLKVLGKGNKERLVPFGQACEDALRRWCERFRPQFEGEAGTHIFLVGGGDAVSINALELMVKKAGGRLGIPRLHCHLLRHTFATNYLVKEVGSELRLQQILGHTSLEMVRRYVALASIQTSILERRGSPIDLILSSPKVAHVNRASNAGRRAKPIASRHRLHQQ